MSIALRLACAFLLGIAVSPAFADDSIESAKIARLNSGLISVVTDAVDSQSLNYAADLAAVLDDEDGLRILPVVGRGPVETVSDVLYLKGVDAGIVPSDIFAYMKAHGILDDVDQKLAYVAKLGGAQLHIIARKDIASLADLKGKRVNAGNVTEPRYITASMVFGTLGVAVIGVGGDERAALKQLKDGSADAIVILAQQPSSLVEEIAREGRFHLLPVPLANGLENIYAPAMLSAASYAGLASGGVETVSVSSLFAVFDWRKGSERYYKLRKLANALYSRIGDLQSGERRAQWAEVNFASEVPGWKRYITADEWLADQKKKPTAGPSPEDISAMREQMKTFSAQHRQAMTNQPATVALPYNRPIKWKESQLQ